MPVKAKPSIDDVARRAGVSTATVSRSLNEPDRVKPATREAVRAAIDELGYTPHFGGRALASNRTNTFGAIVPTLENAIFARGLQALEEHLASKGTTLLVASSGYDPIREGDQIRTMLGRGIDGLLLIGTARPDETYHLLGQNNVPVVIAWSSAPESAYPSVGFDNRAGAVTMTKLVLDQGHRDVAMIAGISNGNDRAAERIAGVRQCLKAHGLRLPASRLIEAEYNLRDAGDAMRSLMDQGVPPTAIVCGNDILAVGALMQAKRMGLSVPGDVSIVGYDDIEIASVVEPALTTLHVPHRRMGRAAAEMLLAMRDGEPHDRTVLLDTAPVQRASLGPPGNG